MKENPTTIESCHQSPSLPSEPKEAHKTANNNHNEKGSSSLKPLENGSDDENNGSNFSPSNANESIDEETALHGRPGDDALDVVEDTRGSEAFQDNCGRERLKRHRLDVAGRVWIPDLWGQEDLLKNWIDCSAFDASLVHNGIMSARAALVEEGRRANSGGLSIENRC